MKICYLISSLANEGPTNVLYNIIKYMDSNIFRVSVITLMPEKSNSRLGDFKKLAVNIIQLNPSGKLGLIRLFAKMRRTINDIDPDAIHAHCSRSLYLMCLLPRGKYKLVYTIHIYPGFQHINTLGPIKGRIIAYLNNFFTKKCDMPIGCSESVGWQYMTYKRMKILCVPNGASMPVWRYDESERNRLRQNLGLEKEAKYFIYIGRFSPEKNPNILVDVFNRIDKPGIKLIMLGEGVLWKELKERAGENILMVGFTNQVYDYLKAVDYYISASDTEGLSNTILESMSVGLPMILSNIPSHHEVIDNFKPDEVGFVVNQHDCNDVINAIIKIDSLNQMEVSNKIKRLYEKKYTAEIMSNKYQQIYVNIAR